MWAFGVLLYEMTSRITPFVDNKINCDITRIFTNIVITAKNGINITQKLDKKTDPSVLTASSNILFPTKKSALNLSLF
jgi:hypothetical protein